MKSCVREDSVKNVYMEHFLHGKFVLCKNSQIVAKNEDSVKKTAFLG